MSPSTDRLDSVFAPEPDTQKIKHLETMLEKAYPKLVGGDGEELPLPDSVYQMLRHAIHLMAEGRAVSLVPRDHHLSSQEAADLLNISRPHLYTLLDQGQISYIKVGTHRRIRFEDAMNYKRQRDGQRRQALAELTAMSQDLGFYTADEPSTEVKL